MKTKMESISEILMYYLKTGMIEKVQINNCKPNTVLKAQINKYLCD
jgi:hypothetical protein